MALTLERLKELLHYNPKTGFFTWNVQRTGRGGSRPGDVAGSVHGKHGYLKVTIDRKPYYLHRLAWMYVHGAMPSGVIDHINRITTDNRIENLRDTTPQVNSINCSGVHGRPIAGIARRTWKSRSGKRWGWVVSLNINKQNGYVSSHACFAHAVRARKEAVNKFISTPCEESQNGIHPTTK